MSPKPTFARELGAVLAREWMLERRQRYALYGLVLYVLATVMVATLSLRAGRVPSDPAVWSVTLWLLVLFAALTAVAKSFVAERPGQLWQLYGWVSAPALMAGRLVYNSLMLFGLSGVALVSYSGLAGWPGSGADLLGVWALGAVALAGVLTLSSALASRASHGSTLMAVLSLPLLVPQLLTLIRMTTRWGLGADSAANDWVALGALALMPVLVSLLLFPYLWREA